MIRTISTFGPNEIQVLLPNGKQRVIPKWMLDEECCQGMQIVDQPIAAISALFALRDLLQSQRLLAEENPASSDKPLPGGVSLEAEQTRASLRRKNNSEISRSCPAALSRVIKPDVPSRDRRKPKSKKDRGRKR